MSTRTVNQATGNNEERYQAFIKNSQEGIWLVEVDRPIPTHLPVSKQIALMYKHAYLADANLAMARMYGFRSVKPLIGLRLGDLLIESDPQNTAYLTAFVKAGYRLSGVESHEVDRHGQPKYFRNSLTGSVENGLLIRAWGTQADVTEQRQTEIALRQSEERLSVALKAASMGLWVWDVRKDELYWSDELKRMFGLRVSDIVNFKKYSELIHPDDWPDSQAVIKHSMKTGEFYSREHRCMWPDGSVHWLLAQGRAILKDGEPVRVLGITVNIDERKHTEELLRQQNDYLETLHDTALEISKGLHNSREVLRTILNRAAGMAGTRDGYIYLMDEDRQHLTVEIATGIFKKHIGHQIRKGEGLAGRVWKNKKPLAIKDYDNWAGRQASFPKGVLGAGVGIPLSVDGTVIGVIALGHHQKGLFFQRREVQALTRLAELASIVLKNLRLYQQSQEREERFRTMADNAPVMIWVADTTKACTYFNKGWLEFTGRRLAQEIGSGWERSIHPADLKQCKQLYETAFDQRLPFSQEYRVRRHDGKYQWVLDKGAPSYGPHGDFQGYIGSCIDIEDLKQAEALKLSNVSLRTQRAQLVALNKSKDEFISLASHQLRTPATGVKQYIGMLLQGYGGSLTKDQLQLLKTAYESNERQLTIVDDLLRVAHVDSGKVILKKQKINLVSLLRDVIREQTATFRQRRQTIVLEAPKQAVTAQVDTGKIRMVLENLLDNASKYSPEGRNVTVTLAVNAHDVSILIADQGVGIGGNDLSKLFQKFSRVNNPLSTLVGGTGIGLYWAKKIVDLHDGQLLVTSKLHKGTTFTIQLPKA